MEKPDGFGFGNGHGTFVRGVFTYQKPEQGGFPAAVDSHDAQFVPVFQGKGHIGENIPGADPVRQCACADGYHVWLLSCIPLKKVPRWLGGAFYGKFSS